MSITITKLHILLMIILIAGFLAAKNIYRDMEIKIQQKELELLKIAEQERIQKQQEIEKKQEKEYTEKKKIIANELIAIAGEYWKIAKKEGRDLTTGQATLRNAKETFAAGDYQKAWELAHQAIKELKEAKFVDKKYKVRKGDSLWRISAMKQHFGKGKMWPYIWYANRTKIKNPRLIYPTQIFLIPTESWKNYKTQVEKFVQKTKIPKT